MKTTLLIIGILSTIGLTYCVYKLFKTLEDMKKILRESRNNCENIIEKINEYK